METYLGRYGAEVHTFKISLEEKSAHSVKKPKIVFVPPKVL
jgi:hypothetical protein